MCIRDRPYTTFKEWLEADKIQQANVESGQITFTLREGVEVELPQQEETGGAGGLMNALLPEPPQDETAVTEYVTVRLSGVSDAELMKQLEEHLPDGAYTEPVDNSAYLLNLFLAYILPILCLLYTSARSLWRPSLPRTERWWNSLCSPT